MDRWIKVYGYFTAGGDPVFKCPHCGVLHVYGVEHPHKQEICENCGNRNLYPWEDENAKENNTQDA